MSRRNMQSSHWVWPVNTERLNDGSQQRGLGALVALAAFLLLLGGCEASLERNTGVLKAHPNWRQRMLAAERLGWKKSPEAVAPLIEAMKSDEDLFVRNAAVHALGQLKDPSAIEPLLAAMLHDIAVREEASKALAAIGGPTVESRLVSLTRDKDPINREYAVEALALMNSDGHLSAFFEETMMDPSPTVRRQAAEALRAAKPPAGQPSDPLARFIRSPDETIRTHAAEDMGFTQDGAYVPTLIETATNDESAEVRYAACVALGRIGTEEATDALIRLLDDPRVPTDAVLAGFVHAGRERAVEPIIASYERDGFPREEAIDTLAAIGGPRVTEFLQERLATERGAIRRAIIDALADARDLSAAQALIAAFVSDPASQVRVIRTLEKLGGEKVIRFLAKTAVDPDADPAARRAAVRALKKDGAQAEVYLLREAALSQRPEVVLAAREAMEALGLTPPLQPPDLEEARPLRLPPP